jgi:hypothetical protein
MTRLVALGDNRAREATPVKKINCGSLGLDAFRNRVGKKGE